MNGRHPRIQFNAAALLFDLPGCDLPQLPGPEFGIAEFLDERGLDLAALFPLEMDSLADSIPEDCCDRNALDALGTPLRRHLRRMAAPHIFRVVLKKHGIQLFAEPVDVEILQGNLFALVHHAAQIAESRFNRGPQSHIGKGLGL